MVNTQLLEFLRNKDKDEIAHEDATLEVQCPNCGYILNETELSTDLEYKVDGILECPDCEETIQE